MYVMTTEIWPNGNYEKKYPVLQIVGYNSGKKVMDGSTWYENVVPLKARSTLPRTLLMALRK